MKKVLVIIDMQNDFITGPLGNGECQAVVSKIVGRIKWEKYDYIFVTRDTHGEDYLDTREGKNLPVIHCIKDSHGWQIVEEIARELSRIETPVEIVDKPTFGSIELGQKIKDYVDKDSVIDFVGVCTGICVISNVMIAKAVVPEIQINVLADCCACVTQKSHRTALEAMKVCQINIIENEML